MAPDVEVGARRIVEARASGAALGDLPEAHRPRTLAEGYRVQRAATRRWGDRVAGW